MPKLLTTSEHMVLELIVKGLNNKEIAKELNVSVSTVKAHVEKILAKIGVRNRLLAAVYAVRNDLV